MLIAFQSFKLLSNVIYNHYLNFSTKSFKIIDLVH